MASENFNLDNWDFDDIDWETGEGSYRSSTATKSRKRQAIESLTGGFVSGIKQSVLSRSTQRKMIEKSLPNSYVKTYDAAMDTKDAIEDIYQTAVTETAKINDKTANQVKPLVDRFSDKLPNKVRGPLRRWTQKTNPSHKWSAESQEELEAVATINDIFTRRNQEKLQREITAETKTQTGIAKHNNALTRQLIESQQRILSYQEQIDVKWKRKSLELQYKQLYVQRRSLDSQEKLLSLSATSFEAIVKNTALPDYVKTTKYEAGKKALQDKLFGEMVNRFAATPTNIIANMGRNISKNIEKKLGSFGDELSGYLNDFASAGDMAGGAGDLMGRNEQLRGGASMAGGFFANMLLPYLSRKAINKYGNDDKIRNTAGMLGNLHRELPRKMRNVANGRSNSLLLNLVAELGGLKEMYGGQDNVIMKKQDEVLDQSAYFDLLTKKSITDVIPGLLARIHGELVHTRTGTARPLLTYDFKKMRFTSEKKLIDDINKEVVSKTNRQNIRKVHDRLTDTLGMDSLSQPVREAFLEKVTTTAMTGDSFSLQDIANQSDSIFGQLTPPQRQELLDFLETQYGIRLDSSASSADLIEQIRGNMRQRLGNSEKATKAESEVQRALDDIVNFTSRPKNALLKHAKNGKIGALRQLDYVDYDGRGGYNFNPAAYVKSLLRNNVSTGREYDPTNPSNRDFFDNDGNRLDEHGNIIQERTAVDELIDRGTGAVRNRILSTDENSRLGKLLRGLLPADANPPGFKKGGYTGDKEEDEVAGVVHGREFVMNAEATKRLGKENLERLANRAAKENNGNSILNLNRMANNIKHTFESRSLKQLKDSLAIPDKLSEIISFVEDITGKPYTGPQQIVQLYKTDMDVRRLVNQLLSMQNEASKGNKRKITKSTVADIEKPLTDSGAVSDTDQQIDEFIKKHNLPDSKHVRDMLGRAMSGKSYGRIAGTIDVVKGVGQAAATKVGDLATNRAPKSSTVEAVSLLLELASASAKFTGGLFKPGMHMLKLVPWGLKKLVNAVTEIVNFNHVVDGLWIKGEKKPRMTRYGLDNEHYLNGDNNVIKKPQDIEGDIYSIATGTRAIVMTQGDYRGGLYDATGKLIHKPDGMLAKARKKVTGFGWMLTKGAIKGGMKLMGGYIKVTTWPARKIINWLTREDTGDIHVKSAVAAASAADKQIGILEQIQEGITALREKPKKFNDSDGDGDRDGNGIDTIKANQQAKKSEADDRKKSLKEKLKDRLNSFKKKEDGSGGILSGLMGGVKDLASGLFGGAKFLIGGLSRFLMNPAVLATLGVTAAGASTYFKDMLTHGMGQKDWTDDVLPEFANNGLTRTALKMGKSALDNSPVGYGMAAGNWFRNKVIQGAGAVVKGGRHLLSAIPDFLGNSAKFLLGDTIGGAINRFINPGTKVPLFRFRMAQYGFNYWDKKSINAILSLEEMLLKDVIIGGKNKPARLGGNVTVDDAAALFNIKIENGSDELREWTIWFGARFRPVFLSAVTVLQNMTGNGKQLPQVDEVLSKAQKLEFIQKTNFYRAEHNPYDIQSNPFKVDSKLDVASLNDVLTVMKRETKVIEDMPDSEVNKVTDPKKIAADMDKKVIANLSKSNEKDTSGKALDPKKPTTVLGKLISAVGDSISSANASGQRLIKDVFGPTATAAGTGGPSGFLGNVGKMLSNLFSGGINAVSNAANTAVDTVSNFASNVADGVGNMVNYAGNLLSTPLSGSASTIPQAYGSGWGALKGTIVGAARMVGVDPGLLAGMAAQESGLNPNAQNKDSSAGGLFQFIDSTWKSYLTKYGPKYGIPPGTSKTNAAANAILGAQFMRDNIETMQKAGGNVQPGDVYLAHFLGPAGAKKFIGANQNAIAASLDPAAAAKNKTIFYNGGRPRTVSEMRSHLTQLMVNKHRQLGVDIPIGGVGTSAGVMSDKPTGVTTGIGQAVRANVPGGRAIMGAADGIYNHAPGAKAIVNLGRNVVNSMTGGVPISTTNGADKTAPAASMSSRIIAAATGSRPFNISAFVQTLTRNAGPKSKGKCAAYVRMALQAGGMPHPGLGSAYMYANGYLSGCGFNQIDPSTTPQAGDIMVFGAYGKYIHGHICGFTGQQWVSDFKQRSANPYGASFGGRSTMWRHKTATGLAGVASAALNMAGNAMDAAGSAAGMVAKVAAAPIKAVYTNWNKILGKSASDKPVEKKPETVDKDGAKIKTAKDVKSEADAKLKGKDKPKTDNTVTDSNDKSKTPVKPEAKTQTKSETDNPKPVVKTVNGKPVTAKEPDKVAPRPVTYKTVTTDKPKTAATTTDKIITRREATPAAATVTKIVDTNTQKQTRDDTSRKMQQAHMERTNRDMELNNAVLQESLKVQKDMRDRLVSIENYLVNKLKNSATSNAATGNQPQGNQKPTTPYSPQRVGKTEPVSMNK